MKILVVTFVIAAAAAAVVAQDPAPAAPYTEAVKGYTEATKVYAKVVAELAAAKGQGPIKNSPFTAEEVNESVQTLADGNRIVRSSTGKFYRNSEGRVRREGKGGVGGLFGSTYSFGQGVSITSSDLSQKFLLDSRLKTAQVIELDKAQGLTVAGTFNKGVTQEERAKAIARLKDELKNTIKGEVSVVSSTAPLAIAPMPPLAAIGATPFTTQFMASQNNGNFVYSSGNKYDSRTEELGTRDFEGVSAEGTRKVTTIPAGAIGNDREIEVVYERWFSKDLGLVVYSKNTDPRFGEQTYKMTNILRSEPDPSLFSVPTHYRKVGENGTVYRVANRLTASPKLVSAASKAKP